MHGGLPAVHEQEAALKSSRALVCAVGRLAGVASLALYVLLTPPTSASARPTHARGSFARQGSDFRLRGLTVTAHLRGMVYPRGALVRVGVAISNRSSQDVTLQPTCAGHNPSAEVRSGSGRVVYPPALNFPPVPNPACKLGAGLRLRPGQVLRRSLYVILRGAEVQPEALVRTTSSPVRRIVGAALWVRLLPGRAPPVTLVTAPRVSARVERPPGAKGPPLYVGWTACHVSGRTSPNRTAVEEWVRAASVHVVPYPAPNCARLLQWHAVVAWPDYPVASIAYSAS